MIKTRKIRVAGVTFRENYPDNLRQLDKLCDDLDEDQEYFPVELVRDPENSHDPDAIKVLVPALATYFDPWVGFVPAEDAAKWAPKMDAGATYRAYVSGVKVSSENPDKPGLEIIVVNPRVASEVPAPGPSATFTTDFAVDQNKAAKANEGFPSNFWNQAASTS